MTCPADLPIVFNCLPFLRDFDLVTEVLPDQQSVIPNWY
jgi:hypothetical protein